ncbi:MAG: hypothetical protein QGH38_02655 [Candidatus Thalassarchaeaceae archaeon]|nr:hypothetical protein [Candidatus Thalassarchaeaceae archaeon]MEE2630303.1 hypothetical protein [Candidatus Thermoplasmatota archaeon]
MTQDGEPEWRVMAAISSLLILNALFIGFAPSGPWDDKSFSRGIIGLVGASMGYVAWYRATFRRSGLIPWLDLWEEPRRAAKIELGAAILLLACSWVAGNQLQPHLPDPTGLLISLVAMLMILQSLYVLLSLGPLKEN